MGHESIPEDGFFEGMQRRINYLEDVVGVSGNVNADNITSGTLDILRLRFGSFDNLILNPDFDVNGTFTNNSAGLEDPNYYNSGAGGLWASSGSLFHSGQRAARFDVDGQTLTAYLQSNGTFSNPLGHARAAEGDVFHFSAFARYFDNVPTVQPSIRISFRDKDGVDLGATSNDWATLTTSYTKGTVTATAPADTAYIICYIRIGSGNASNVAMGFDSFYARRIVGRDLITESSLPPSKLVSGSSDNIVGSNPIFSHSTDALGDGRMGFDVGDGNGTNGWQIEAHASGRSGANVATFDPTGWNADAWVAMHFGTPEQYWKDPAILNSATEGDQFYFEFYARTWSGTVWPNVFARILYYDDALAYLGGTIGTTLSGLTSTWQKASATDTGAPANTSFVAFIAYVDYHATNDDEIGLDSFYARRMVGNSIIEADAVDTAQIAPLAITDAEINDVAGPTITGTIADARLEPTIGNKTFQGTTGTAFRYAASTTSGFSYNVSNLYARVGGTDLLTINSIAVKAHRDIHPSVDNTYDLGSTSTTLRWDDVFATSGVVNSSDPSLKNSMEPTPLGTDFIKGLKPIRWKWNDTKDSVAIEGVHAQILALEETLEAALNDDGTETPESRKIEEDVAALGDSIPTLRKVGVRWHHGFDVTNFGHNESGFIVGKPGNLGIRTGELTAPIVTTLQEILDRLDAAGI